MSLLRALWEDRTAATAVEYALLAVLVSFAAISSIYQVGNALSNVFLAVATDMSNANAGSI